MNENIKKEILENTFIDQIRTEMKVDEPEYKKLCEALSLLAESLKKSECIDRELMLSLYSMPMIVRNTFESFPKEDPLPAIVYRLEDCWIELDELITECLVD